MTIGTPKPLATGTWARSIRTGSITVLRSYWSSGGARPFGPWRGQAREPLGDRRRGTTTSTWTMGLLSHFLFEEGFDLSKVRSHGLQANEDHLGRDARDAAALRVREALEGTVLDVPVHAFDGAPQPLIGLVVLRASMSE